MSENLPTANQTTAGIPKEPSTVAPFPIPVPRSMRTRRNVPRIVALVITIAWACIFIQGTRSLARTLETEHTALDRFLVEGEKFWAYTGPDGSCSAYFVSKLTIPHTMEMKATAVSNLLGTPEFSLIGALRLSIFEKPALARLDFGSTFTSFLALDSFDSTFRVGEATFNAHTGAGSNVEVQMQLGDQTWGDSLPKPESIYLVKREDGQFKLRIPDSVQKVLTQRRVTIPVETTFKELSKDEFVSCKAQVETPNANAPKGAELGPYLRLFNINEQSPILTKMTSGAM